VRRYRRLFEGSLSVLGVLTIFAGLLLVSSDSVQAQIMVVLAGILALEAGVWGLGQQLLPNDRQFLDLRVEGEHFIDLMRDLNTAALARNQGAGDTGDTADTADTGDADTRFTEVLTLMHQSVDQMGEFAGNVS